MEKETRNRIQRATQTARTLIESEYSKQLGGNFDIHLNGSIGQEPGDHLGPKDCVIRDKLIAAINHHQSAGMPKDEAVAMYLREAAFTLLNRFVALKMLEARDLVQQCISRGDQSAGFKEFLGLAPGLVQLPDNGYRLYIESIFDEIGREVRVLFDRRDSASLLWPSRQTLLELLDILNAKEISAIWIEDETIGWVYQFFNGEDERRKMRDESAAPRNSHELAVRNQFFTPRYVVQLLVDNTLGRMWYEMMTGDTQLHELKFLIHPQHEIFLEESQEPIAEFEAIIPGESDTQPLQVPFRKKKDPRDLQILDPACGSGHFLLYTFDLLLEIYVEAWNDEFAPASTETGQTLREDFTDFDDLQIQLPRLIIENNLYGIDIDLRCTQIAALSLWMRAQRAYLNLGINKLNRKPISKANIAVAQAMPGESMYQNDFAATIDQRLGLLVHRVFQRMELAGEAGSLLMIEADIREAILEIYGQHGDLFRANDEERWYEVEQELLFALKEYLKLDQTFGRKLFADDTAVGLGFIEISSKRYDVILMNPPFGSFSTPSKGLIFSAYGREKIELGGCFITRFIQRLSDGGKLGVVANRTLLFAASLEEWRSSQLSGVEVVADLGHGVLDALVEVAAFTLSNSTRNLAFFTGTLDTKEKDRSLRAAAKKARSGDVKAFRSTSEFASLFGSPFAYWAPNTLIQAVTNQEPAESVGAVARQGLATCDNFRFLRLAHELPPNCAAEWKPLAKGGEYQPFWSEIPLRARWKDDGHEIKAYIDALHGQWSRVVQSTSLYGIPGATYSERTASSLSLRVLPKGCLFDKVGPFVGASDPELSRSIALVLIGMSYTTAYRFLIETAVGLRDATSSGSAARHYLPSMIQRLPWPNIDLEEIKKVSIKAIEAARDLVSVNEGSEFWHDPFIPSSSTTLEEYSSNLTRWWCDKLVTIYECAEIFESASLETFGISADEDIKALEEVSGISPLRYSKNEAIDTNQLLDYLEIPPEDLISELSSVGKIHSTTYKKAYWGNRSIELLAHLWETHPLSLVKALMGTTVSNKWKEQAAWRLLSIGFGISVNRLNPEQFFTKTVVAVSKDIFATPTHESKNVGGTVELTRILVDDQGHPDDVVTAVEEAIQKQLPNITTSQLIESTGSKRRNLRQLLANDFFDLHLSTYSEFRRKAPIYWQISTPSASYSAWLYYHHITRDTLFRFLNEYITPKIKHEERKLTSITQEYGPNPTTSQRKEIDSQETFVGELRGFRDEITRVAPLWNPNLNDGVILNFAPLWRLVPHHKTWQKECKSAWDKLCKGDYDWAHITMHLWPERVVPKCAEDRSLAIAHELEEMFWYEDEEGKWHQQDVSQEAVEKLISERTSPAVKDAVKTLQEAPSPSSPSSPRKKKSSPRKPVKSPKATKQKAKTMDMFDEGETS
jgi:hypothetical protein